LDSLPIGFKWCGREDEIWTYTIRKEHWNSKKKGLKKSALDAINWWKKFERVLRINNYSISRIEKYWTSLRTIHKILEKCFEDKKT